MISCPDLSPTKSATSHQHRRLDVPGRGAGCFIRKARHQAKELSYAASKLTSIEINAGTYYGSQKPEAFANGRIEVPDEFIFSLKGPRLRPAPRACGSRRFRQAVLPIPRAGGSATGSSQLPAIRADQGNSTKPISAIPRAAALAHWPCVAPCGRCGMTAFACRIRRAVARIETPVVFAEHGKYPTRLPTSLPGFRPARLRKTAG